MLPTPLAKWPLNLEHGLNDVSGNNLNFVWQTGASIDISMDAVAGHGFLNMDGSFKARAHVGSTLTLSADFTVTFALRAFRAGMVFAFGTTEEETQALSLYMITTRDMRLRDINVSFIALHFSCKLSLTMIVMNL